MKFFNTTFTNPLEMEVSWNGGTLKSSMIVGLSIISHPFLDSPIYECETPKWGTEDGGFLSVAFGGPERIRQVAQGGER